VPGDVLSKRELNRALLGRQFLLERAEVPIADAIEHLVGQQAQQPWDPYYGLWSRLRDFDPHELGRMIERFEVVRMGAMRGTIHLMTARDALVLRGAMAPVVKYSRQVKGVDLDELVAIAAQLTAENPRGRVDLSRALSERWPDADFDDLGYTAAVLLPLVQAPPRAVWGKTRAAKWLHAEKALGAPVEWDADLGEVVLRYLKAFGPAAPKDVRAWCYLTGLRDVIDGLRPRLRVWRTEDGGELLDVENGLFPDPETPAPVRFLPEFENAILGFADRSRILPPGAGRPYWKGAVLVDGFAAGTWRFDRSGEAVAIEVGLWRKLTRAEGSDVEAEASALLEWTEPDAHGGEVRIGEPD
jgi:hypothetical protein